MVNGGGSLTLRFQRSSFVPISIVVFTPWNKFVVIPKTAMRTLREPIEADRPNGSCDVSVLAQPSAAILITSVRAYTTAECAEKGSIIPEIRVKIPFLIQLKLMNQ